ncbi:MAG: hypothetical protein LBR96_07395 [Treponema sp.]|jgi:hypothetical protein|nr:hypothetical protein [Treponema sp.]
MKFKKETFLSPSGFFFIYLILAFALIIGFSCFFPGERIPLGIYATPWRLLRGVFRIINLFPALTLSGLVIPFGFLEGKSAGAAALFLERMRGPLTAAIAGAILNAVLYFAALPPVDAALSGMRYRGELYVSSLTQAKTAAAEGNWNETARYIGICDSIWPESAGAQDLREEAALQIEELHYKEAQAEAAEYPMARLSALPGQRQPVNAREALDMAETALREKRYFDSHWLATLAGRIAPDGSPEEADAALLASRAWNSLEAMSPGSMEEEIRSGFFLKRSGYEAMIAGEWIRAYYIFRELREKTPQDPDVEAFLAKSEEGSRESAFFTDEIEMLGELITGAVFSIPYRDPYRGPDSPFTGRGVLRFRSLSCFPDYSWAMGLEFLAWDGEGVSRVKAPYAQILPKTLGSRPMTAVRMRALDRHDEKIRFEPVIEGEALSVVGDAELLIDLPYDSFLLLTKLRQGESALSVGELFTASRSLGSSGYLPESFQAEIIRRLGGPLFLLPLGILALSLGWRLRLRLQTRAQKRAQERGQKRPYAAGIPMLFVLPLVWNGIFELCRVLIEAAGVQLIFKAGFFWAFLALIGGAAILFILSLILFAMSPSEP